jgi:nicotinamide mononucleotide transporter
MNYYEIAGALISLICVWFNTRQNILGWPTAMLGAALYFVVFMQEKLYADMALQVVFFTLSGYGWYQWLYGGKNESPLAVSKMPFRLLPLLIMMCIAATFLSGYLLDNYTDADIAYIDAFTTIVSLIAQWMLAKKFIENWLVWVAVDVIYVGVYWYKELYTTCVLYFIFIILAVMGYLQWKKTLTRKPEIIA